jgi:hypothetical protein
MKAVKVDENLVALNIKTTTFEIKLKIRERIRK